MAQAPSEAALEEMWIGFAHWGEGLDEDSWATLG